MSLPPSKFEQTWLKDALLIELLRRYHADLDRVGEIAFGKLDEREPRPVAVQIVDLGRAIARTAVEHRAALQMSFYERHGSAPELIELTQRRPTAYRLRCKASCVLAGGAAI